MRQARLRARVKVRDQHKFLRRLAAKVFWWKTQEEALRDPIRFVVQVMTYGDWTEVQAARRHFGEKVFRSALRDPPPGVFDNRSWAYWHTVLRVHPIPGLPRRKLP